MTKQCIVSGCDAPRATKGRRADGSQKYHTRCRSHQKEYKRSLPPWWKRKGGDA